VSLVFGPEASGLTREELALCHLVVRIPTDALQPSLNLAQAVLIVVYEIFVSGKTPRQEDEPPRATVGEMETALGSLGKGLEGIGYLNAQNPGPIVSELRALLVRAQVTPREIALLSGMGRQILWASDEIARARGGKG
jgi:tRNA/rRNA methyltransferase